MKDNSQTPIFLKYLFLHQQKSNKQLVRKDHQQATE